MDKTDKTVGDSIRERSTEQAITETPSEIVKPLTSGMRWLLYIASALVLSMGINLFLFSEQTDRFFAWTVKPSLTAAFLGAAYLASFVIEFMSARNAIWARARVAVPSVLTFTTLTLIATLLHLDRFHLGSNYDASQQIVTWLWIAIYAVVPPIMAVLLVLQLRTPGGDPPRASPFEAWVRVVLAVQGVTMLAIGLGLFLAPAVFSSVWPWQLTPLTSQAVGAWLIGLGIATLQANWENDQNRVQVATISYAMIGVLQLIAIVRFTDTVDWGKANTWLYLLFLVSMLAIGVYSLWKVNWAKSQL
jgi:hypothetical protein